MATGPQRARLDRALAGAHPGEITDRAGEWDRCRDILNQISMSLAAASPKVKERIGGRTGPAIDAAFHRSAQRMGDKAAVLVDGARALRNAADAITAAKAEQENLAAHPLTEPPAYQKPSGQPTPADLRAEAQNRQAHSDYQAAYADQESRAKARADAMDRVFQDSAATMKKIHGEPDPQPSDSSGDGVGGSGGGVSGGVGGGVGGGSVPTGGGGGGPRHTDGPGPGDVGHPQPAPSPAPGPGYVPGDPVTSPGVGGPQGGGSVDPVSIPASGGTSGGVLGSTGTSATGGSISAGTGLGLAGAAAGGAAGGLLGTGMSAGGIRGGLTTPIVANPGTAAGGVRGIGTTSRTGVTGALGRSGGVGAVSSGSGSRGSGRSGSSAAAGRRGTTGASRGAAGGRGTGSVATGRGGRRKDEEKGRKRDLFDTGDDWVEDEDAAPGVLD